MRNLYGLIAVAGMIIWLVTGIMLVVKKKAPNVGKAMIFAIAAYITVLSGFITLLLIALGTNSKFVDFYAVIIIIAVLLILFSVVGALWGFIKKKKFYLPVIIAASACVLSVIGVESYNGYIEAIPTVRESEALIWQYAPYEADSKVAELGERASLELTDDLPRLDGATALYPVYSAFAKAVYPMKSIMETGNSDVLDCTKTNMAYEKIVTGEADIIFVAGPSAAQEEFAEENGVELVYTPIGKEGFVFFVNSENPLDDITVPEIQGIYSGELTRWNELGVEGFGAIKAFQRPEGSGSQSGLQRLMAGKEIMEAPTEDIIDGMGGIIAKTADYKNFKNAIGYSYRFYSTEMVQNNKIKLLSIDGVYPSEENIRNGSYPIANNFYAVTRSDASENTKKLVEWILSEEGQRLIELTGYTPM